ncbi:metal ABC transporter substrate-binding protein [Marichromatium bheemlicum]|uniref:Zinc ABC transporter solute-binding protein n=1 Tax=Marichromatium bheemlicum TaxID=365339 RepID=A0ABX1I8C6_9GAMM|nr:metal ABC transporter substrate-binding protein [Marichromatium bheemlicum]NKN32460.1 zinc ABC transporter solute-binding protein [Marichromatium bheemlicum]
MNSSLMIRAGVLLAALVALPAQALEVVATSPSMGALVRAVGGADTALTVLSGPERDLHRLQARPSMIGALRRADLVVAVGAELEIGWLPLAIASAANPAIRPETPGYFEAAAQVALLDVGTPADRALGDVHPLGNPHLNLDPLRMATVARALAERMAALDPAGGPDYRAGAARFAAAVERRLPAWSARLDGAPGAVLHHRDGVYLLDRFGVPLLGTIEPVPGVPPSGRQLNALTERLRGQAGVVIHTPYQPARPAERVAAALDWPVAVLALEPARAADGAAYLAHIDRWVEVLAGAARR